MKIMIFHAEAGYGHKKVAQVLAQAFKDRGADNVLVEDALEECPWIFRKSYPAIYFFSVKYAPEIWGWFYETFDNPAVYTLIKPLRSFANRIHGARLLAKVRKENPDVIICSHFFSAELFGTAKIKGQLQSKLITVLTDFFPHTFWVNEGTDTYWVMSEEAARDLVKRGVPRNKIQALGIPIERKFLPAGKKKENLSKWSFTPDRLTILLTMGSFGLGPQLAILKALEVFPDKIQCFVVCGNNQEMKSLLESEKFQFPVKIFGFIDFMPELMEAADLMIAKSGGSTTTESLAKGVPMVVFRPIPGQETRNARLLKERNAAFFMYDPDQIKIILKAIFDHPEMMAEKKRAIQALAKPYAADELVSFALSASISENPDAGK